MSARGSTREASPPYGYLKVKVSDGKKERASFVPDPDTAPVVDRIFEMTPKRMDAVQIARQLNKEGITGPGSKGWGKGTVGKVLTKEAYAGTRVWGITSEARHKLDAIRVENAWEAPTDKKTCDRAQRTLAGCGRLQSSCPFPIHNANGKTENDR